MFHISALINTDKNAQMSFEILLQHNGSNTQVQDA